MDKLKGLISVLKPSPRMPVLFVGHGNPMNAILDNEITRNWAKIGSQLPDPQAFVVISAHWMTNGTRVTGPPKQQIIYDMYGFPGELYQVEYPHPVTQKLPKKCAGHSFGTRPSSTAPGAWIMAPGRS